MARVVYSSKYDMGLLGLERMHPFDVHKYSRAWQILKYEVSSFSDIWIEPDREVSREELLAVHSEPYLESLHSSQTIAKIFEVPQARWVPATLLDSGFLSPMRWATRGTVLAAREALSKGLAIHLGGGFHHAKPDQGEGFCVYSDIALAIHDLNQFSRIGSENKVLYIDLDAHMGNGVAHHFLHDSRVLIYDQFNSEIYPRSDQAAWARIDWPIPIPIGCSGSKYLTLLKEQLPQFLESVPAGLIGLAIYNAGTDPVSVDPLGLLDLREDDILERDAFVVSTMRKLRIPTLTLTSGGYTDSSHRLIANSCRAWLQIDRETPK